MNNAKLSPEPKAPLLKPQLPDKLIPLVRQTWIILCITDAFKGELYHLGQKYLCQRRWLKMSGWRLATVTVAMGFFFSIERNKASSLWKNKSLSLLCVFVCGWYLHVLCCLFTVHMSYCCIHVSHAYMNSIFILLSNALSSRVNFLLNLCMSPIHPHLLRVQPRGSGAMSHPRGQSQNRSSPSHPSSDYSLKEGTRHSELRRTQTASPPKQTSHQERF